MEDILRLMRRVPVEGTDQRTFPPKLEDGYPYFYRYDLVPQAAFADKSPEEVRDLTLAKVEAFLDSDSSDFGKVGRYLEVLAFQPSPG